jgi:hypothetical protein
MIRITFSHQCGRVRQFDLATLNMVVAELFAAFNARLGENNITYEVISHVV